jgi:hypothetical protein
MDLQLERTRVSTGPSDNGRERLRWPSQSQASVVPDLRCSPSPMGQRHTWSVGAWPRGGGVCLGGAVADERQPQAMEPVRFELQKATSQRCSRSSRRVRDRQMHGCRSRGRCLRRSRCQCSRPTFAQQQSRRDDGSGLASHDYSDSATCSYSVRSATECHSSRLALWAFVAAEQFTQSASPMSNSFAEVLIEVGDAVAHVTCVERVPCVGAHTPCLTFRFSSAMISPPAQACLRVEV